MYVSKKSEEKKKKKTRKWMWYIKAQSLRPVTGTGQSLMPSCGHRRDNLRSIVEIVVTLTM